MDVIAVQQAKQAVKKSKAAQTSLQVVASRPNTYYRGLLGSSGTSTFRTKHIALCNITSLSPMYGNFYGGNNGASGDGPGNLTVSCSVEVGGSSGVTGTITRGYLRGSRSATVEPGGSVTFDPIPVSIKKGTAFYVRTYVSGNWPIGMFGNYAKGKGGLDTVGDGLADSGEGDNGTAGADLTASGSISATFGSPYSPMALLGTTSDGKIPVVAFIGDSILNYTWDLPDTGFLWRALGNTVPYVKLSQPGETTQQWAKSGGNLVEGRWRLLRYATHAICEYGRNDLSALNRTTAQIQADLITVWTALANNGITAWQTTILPKTTSTDRWATTANQTVTADNAQRVPLNQWLRAGAPMVAGAAVAVGTGGAIVAGQAGHPLRAVIDVCPAAESATDSGLWVARGRLVTDAAMTSGTNVLTSATAAFTSADVGKTVTVAGAAAGPADLQGLYVQSVTNATTVVLSGNAGVTVSGATAVIDTATPDGIHPSVSIHQAVAALMPTSQFVA